MAHAPSPLMENSAPNMDGVFKVPAPVGMKRRDKRPLSSQPSKSAMSCAPCALEEEPTPVASRNQNATSGPDSSLESVNCHNDQGLFNEIGPLRGLKLGRRRVRWRRLNRAKLELNYSEAIKCLKPMLLEELVNQQSHHVLIASALEHFANTVNGIVNKPEGKLEPNEYTLTLEEFKKKAVELAEERRLKEALSTGDWKKERISND